jgi:hypothetical protein
MVRIILPPCSYAQVTGVPVPGCPDMEGMLYKILHAAGYGIDANIVDVGVDVAATTSAADHCHTIGCRTPLPPPKNCGYDIAHTQIITNLTPADMQKKGAGFDLPIVWGILRAYSESARTGRSPAVTGGSSFEWLQPGCG